MSFIGLSYALSQEYLVKRVVGVWFPDPKNRPTILLVFCVALTVGRVLAFETDSVVVVYALFSTMVVSLGVANIVIGTKASVLVPVHTVGTLFGTLESVENAGGIVGPILGRALYALSNKEDDGNIDISHVTAPLIAVASCYGVVLTMLYFGYERVVMQGRYNNKKDDAYISNMNDDMRTSVESTPAVRVSSKIV